jgi:predicted Zn-dependent protease
MLAGAVLIATTGGAAGIAALSASQAAALDSQLRHSRAAEQEADRIGMQTLVDAGMDPHAAPAMFERMLQNTRYSSASRVPEFLRTHPLSESRISDTRNRARQYPRTQQQASLSYHLMRARMRVHHADTPQRAAETFRNSLEGNPASREAARYGLVLALTASGQPARAQAELQKLLAQDPTRIEYIVAQAELDMSIGESQSAVRLLQRELRLFPNNHALTMAQARALLMNDQAHIAEEILLEQSHLRADDPGLWYLLAEVQGLSGNIAGLHQSRAEYFILNGVLDEAERQLNYAMELSRNDYHSAAKISQRLRDIAELRERMEF